MMAMRDHQAKQGQSIAGAKTGRLERWMDFHQQNGAASDRDEQRIETLSASEGR
jgi:hypothetical protein